MKKAVIVLAMLSTIGCKNPRIVGGTSIVIGVESNGATTNIYTISNYNRYGFDNQCPKFIGGKDLYSVGDTVRFK